jgi:hypothetical protein
VRTLALGVEARDGLDGRFANASVSLVQDTSLNDRRPAAPGRVAVDLGDAVLVEVDGEGVGDQVEPA